MVYNGYRRLPAEMELYTLFLAAMALTIPLTSSSDFPSGMASLSTFMPDGTTVYSSSKELTPHGLQHLLLFLRGRWNIFSHALALLFTYLLICCAVH